MKAFLLKNKFRLIFLCTFVLLLVVTFLLGIFVPSLKFFELIPLAILLGFGFTSFLRNILPIKNILTFISLSLFLGMFINTFIIFMIGVLGLNVGLPMLMIYIPIVFILNIFLFLRFIKEEDIAGYFKNTKFEWIDIAWLVILGALFLIFAGVCLERYYFLWDGFTFWALDAKYIFQNEHFRDGSFAVLTNNYLSFYSLQINYVYLIYNKIVEQTAGLLSLMYSYTGVLIISSYIIDIKKSLFKKTFLYIGILAALYSFFTTHSLLMSLYADVSLAVVVLFYSLVLFNKEFKDKYYWQRFLLLVLLSVSVYLTKTHFYIFSLLLLVFLVVFDFKILLNKIKHITKEYWFVGVIVILAIIGLLIARYAKTITKDEGDFTKSIVNSMVIDKTVLSNIKNMVKDLLLKIPLIAFSIALYLPITFFVKKGFLWKDFIRIIFLGLLVSFTLVVYAFGIYPISDGSMYRYLGLTYLALPFLFIDILPNFEIEKKWQKIIGIIAIMGGVALIFVQLCFHAGVDLKYTPNSGSYIESEAHKEYSNIVDEVKKIVPKGEHILIASYGIVGGNLTDNFPPGYFLRYYLLEYSGNPSYYCAPVNCLPYFVAQKPDYLLIYSYSDFWPACNGVLENKKSYLIKFDLTQEELNSGKCLADENNTRAL